MLPAKLGGAASAALAFSEMPGNDSPSSHHSVCPSCGYRQEPGGRECGRCGYPLDTSGLIYRREADGTWTIVRDIDLSSLAPQAPPVPRKRFSPQAALAILVLLVLGAALDLGLWHRRVVAGRHESEEIAYYLSHPVGIIEPRFSLQYSTTEQGQLRVGGQTNLPNGTNLQVEVYAKDLILAIDYPVVVFGGQFQTRALLERGKPFVTGPYQARLGATFDAISQPPAVLRVVGEGGERIQGPLVRRVEAPSGAKVRYVEDFSLR